MPAVPTQRTWVDDDALNTTNLNGFVSDPLKFLLNPPIAQVRQTAPQSIPNNTFTAITFGVEDVDTDMDGVGGHSTSSNTSRYTARYPGWYEVSGGCGWVSGGGSRSLRWAVNGTAVNGSSESFPAPAAAAIIIYPSRTMLVFLDIGDFVELQVLQTSGAALNTFIAADAYPHMSVMWKSR